MAEVNSLRSLMFGAGLILISNFIYIGKYYIILQRFLIVIHSTYKIDVVSSLLLLVQPERIYLNLLSMGATICYRSVNICILLVLVI